MASQIPLIAIVDDDEDVRKALGRLASSAGYDVETHASGAAFVASLRSRRPDCVLLDLQMPVTSGFDVQREMGAFGHGSIPVVIITGNDSPESQRLAYGLGACAYLCKPVEGDLLLASIHAAIGDGPDEVRAAANVAKGAGVGGGGFAGGRR